MCISYVSITNICIKYLLCSYFLDWVRFQPLQGYHNMESGIRNQKSGVKNQKLELSGIVSYLALSYPTTQLGMTKSALTYNKNIRSHRQQAVRSACAAHRIGYTIRRRGNNNPSIRTEAFTRPPQYIYILFERPSAYTRVIGYTLHHHYTDSVQMMAWRLLFLGVRIGLITIGIYLIFNKFAAINPCVTLCYCVDDVPNVPMRLHSIVSHKLIYQNHLQAAAAAAMKTWASTASCILLPNAKGAFGCGVKKQVTKLRWRKYLRMR